MPLHLLKPGTNSVIWSFAIVLFAASALSQSASSRIELSSTHDHVSSSGHQLVVLIDINPHQENVLEVEISLAVGIIQKLNQPENVFSVITFGLQTPNLLKQNVAAAEAIATLRNVAIEQTREKYFSIRFYDALSLAMNQFSNHTSADTLLIISEGNDHFPHKTFKDTVERAQQFEVACDVAMVADHTFYGTKGIQRYGFDLRRLARKTHGQYVEVGGKDTKVSRSVERFSQGILSRGRKSISFLR